MPRLTAPPLQTGRLDLEPLTVGHATEMVEVLADPAIYTVIGGAPPSLEQLRATYARQVAGPGAAADAGEADGAWLNWVVRRLDTGEAAGYVQATLGAGAQSAGGSAELAWVLGPRHQGQGFATEATRAVVAWLATAGARRLSAYVAPGHTPSERVAAALGLSATDQLVDGEVRWTRPAE